MYSRAWGTNYEMNSFQQVHHVFLHMESIEFAFCSRTKLCLSPDREETKNFWKRLLRLLSRLTCEKQWEMPLWQLLPPLGMSWNNWIFAWWEWWVLLHGDEYSNSGGAPSYRDDICCWSYWGADPSGSRGEAPLHSGTAWNHGKFAWNWLKLRH